MIRISDRTRGAPGSLEAWTCWDCSKETSLPQRKVVVIQETIDLTLDSDSEDDIQVIEHKVKQELRPGTNEVDMREAESEKSNHVEISSAPVTASAVHTAASSSSSGQPAFEPYARPPYLDTLIKNRESAARAHLTSLFPPKPARAEYHTLFVTGSAAKQMSSNPFTQWLGIAPAFITPIRNPERQRRKPVAKHANLSWSQETGWTSWRE